MTITRQPIVPTAEYKTARLFVGDCRSVMALMRNDHTIHYDLIFADPPFNIKQSYADYTDSMPLGEYEQFTRNWITQATLLLRDGGTLCINVPDSVVEIVLRSTCSLLQRADWIIWHYRFGQAGAAARSPHCITSKSHLLVYVKGNMLQRTWNPPMVESDRSAVYGDARTQETATPGKRVCLDVWGVPSDGPYWGRVQGNNAERWDIKHGALFDHPNQLPEVYVERAIQAFSNKSSRLLCPFGGAGTEAVVATAMGRYIDVIDLSEVGVASIIKRLERGAIRVGNDTQAV